MMQHNIRVHGISLNIPLEVGKVCPVSPMLGTDVEVSASSFGERLGGDIVRSFRPFAGSSVSRQSCTITRRALNGSPWARGPASGDAGPQCGSYHCFYDAKAVT